jgi:hypothetical protein
MPGGGVITILTGAITGGVMAPIGTTLVSLIDDGSSPPSPTRGEGGDAKPALADFTVFPENYQPRINSSPQNSSTFSEIAR